MNKDKLIEKILVDNKCFKKNKIYYSNDIKIKQSHISENTSNSIITYIKETIKQNYFLYYLIINIFSPVYFNLGVIKIRNRLILNNEIVLNIGSGNKIINNKIINIDIFSYKNVDIVADGKNLPIKDNSADLVINEVNLEHIFDFESVISESFRILKKGGTVFYIIPFIQGFHASPYDFHRFTYKSIYNHFENAGFTSIDIGIFSGPASGFLWILIDFLSILLSFGIKQLYEIFLILFMLILWPIKILDILLNKYSYSKNIASSFYIIAKK